MSSYSLRPSNQQRNFREMAQIMDAVVTPKVARLRDRCKPPIAEDIYDEILLLMEEKLQSGKVASLLTVSEKARKYWRTHGREFVDLVDLQEHLGRPSKGILLKNSRALLSESLAEELVVRYVAERGPQSVQRDMQSLFELPLPLIQTYVQRSTNVRLAKDRRYMRLKFEERMSELRQQTLAEAAAAAGAEVNHGSATAAMSAGAETCPVTNQLLAKMHSSENFENVTLRITGHHMPPMSAVVTQADRTTKFAGISGFMFDLIVEAMRFKYVVKLPPDYSWGARDVHGQWAGQFGMVVRNESDLLVGPVAPTYDRASALEPLPQFFYAEGIHCGGLRDPFITNVFGYVNSFDVEVWISLFSAMLFVSFVVALIDASYRCSRLPFFYYFAFLDLFGIFLMEASPRITIGSAKRWLIGTWWLAVFVLAAGFTGHMKASLTMKDPRPRLYTVRDILEHKEVLPVIIRGTTFEERFRNSDDIYQRMVWVKANRLGTIMPVKEVFTKQTFDEVLQSKKVVFLDRTLLYTALARLYAKDRPKGMFYESKEITMNLTMGMWINRDFPSDLRKAIHKRTRWVIESGLPEWYRLTILEQAKRKSEAGTTTGHTFTFNTIQVEDVTGLFYLLLACFTVCFVAVVIECCVYTISKSHCCRRR